MTDHQKSRKELIHITSIPLGIRLAETPLPYSQQKENKGLYNVQRLSGNGLNSADVGCSDSKTIPADTNPLEICLWHEIGECAKSGLREHVKKDVYDGVKCKCFAYVSKEYGDKK